MNRKLMYVSTIGCQMNVYDSGQIVAMLSSMGFLETKDIYESDLVILNTCSIRQKAEQKAFSFLGKLAKIKKKNTSLIIAVGGCLAQQYGKDLLNRLSYVDLVFGTNAIYNLPKLIMRIESDRCRISDVNISSRCLDQDFFIVSEKENKKISEFVTIVRGCNNYCTYCVVPYLRGKETSRNSENILNEIKTLVDSGVKEIVLLGQNVNSYGVNNGFFDFPKLLCKINQINGLERIRFMTSHPKDLSENLMNAFVSLNKLCHHIHLPVQSGNNDILKQMNRKYTVEEYKEKIVKLRTKCPKIAITSDFIVGFPGETRYQFNSTLDLIETIQFDGLYAFSYSDRINTVASKFKNKISEDEKKNRLHKLLNLQDSIMLKKNLTSIGNIEKVLVEGPCRNFGLSDYNKSISNISYLFGRTETNKIVHFWIEGKNKLKSFRGSVMKVEILEANSHSLLGKNVNF